MLENTVETMLGKMAAFWELGGAVWKRKGVLSNKYYFINLS